MSYNAYSGQSDYKHDTVARVGVLVVNLGTPDAPTAKALRPYLKKFLFDPRVIEVRPIVWWFIMRFFVLPFRPKRSAALYKNIWTKDGSPLLLHTAKQTEKLEQRLQERFGDQVVVEYAMRIGQPGLDKGLKALQARGAQKLLVLPMFPQYSGTTTASVFDGVTEELQKWRWIPEFRMISHFHDQPGYVAALAQSIREVWDRDGEPEKLIMSFHGIPQRYYENGDPYPCMCQRTGRELREALGLDSERAIITFQSLFGREEWVKPYTEDTIEELAQSGVKSLDVICPGFTADCLETVDEIDREAREVFEEHGGKEFRYLPCLNDRDDFIEVLADVCERNLMGWIERSHSQEELRANAQACQARYQELKAGNS
jgi:ferrochelatase